MSRLPRRSDRRRGPKWRRLRTMMSPGGCTGGLERVRSICTQCVALGRTGGAQVQVAQVQLTAPESYKAAQPTPHLTTPPTRPYLAHTTPDGSPHTCPCPAHITPAGSTHNPLPSPHHTCWLDPCKAASQRQVQVPQVGQAGHQLKHQLGGDHWVAAVREAQPLQAWAHASRGQQADTGWDRLQRGGCGAAPSSPLAPLVHFLTGAPIVHFLTGAPIVLILIGCLLAQAMRDQLS
jgi:hypothetical protein